MRKWFWGLAALLLLIVGAAAVLTGHPDRGLSVAGLGAFCAGLSFGIGKPNITNRLPSWSNRVHANIHLPNCDRDLVLMEGYNDGGWDFPFLAVPAGTIPEKTSEGEVVNRIYVDEDNGTITSSHAKY